MSAPAMNLTSDRKDGIANGEELLRVDNVTLRFGGVTAIEDIYGAGKTSMLNVINGFYHPQEGTIRFRGDTRTKMKPYEAAASGIARTFQNVALFTGMSTLDNIMSGRSLKMKKNFLTQMLYYGPARDEDGSRLGARTPSVAS